MNEPLTDIGGNIIPTNNLVKNYIKNKKKKKKAKVYIVEAEESSSDNNEEEVEKMKEQLLKQKTASI